MWTPPRDPPELEERPWSPRVRLVVFVLAVGLSWAGTLALIFSGWEVVVGLLRGRCGRWRGVARLRMTKGVGGSSGCGAHTLRRA